MSRMSKHPDSCSQDAIFVSVIIVNWNGAAVLPRCLQSLGKQTYRNYELIIVDNGSTDRSCEGLEEKWPGIKVIRFSENKGFAVANNEGVRQAVGDWVALLNSDAFPEPDWLSQLVSAARNYADGFFFGSTLLQAEQPELLDGTGDVYHISGLAWRRHHKKPRYLIGNEIEEVFSPCAAAALYHRKTFLDVGGFDENFFMYHEDVDLGFRLRLQGYRCLYVPKAVVHHMGSASTSVKSDLAVYFGHRNLVWSYFKNMPGELLWKYLIFHIFANLIFIIYYTLRGQPVPIWRAKWHALLRLPEVIKQRQLIQNNRQVQPKEISRVLERGWLKPYLMELKERS